MKHSHFSSGLVVCPVQFRLQLRVPMHPLKKDMIQLLKKKESGMSKGVYLTLGFRWNHTTIFANAKYSGHTYTGRRPLIFARSLGEREPELWHRVTKVNT